jgi:tungstate transport system ATP-binding protein
VILYRLSQLTKTYRNRTVLDIPFLEIEQGRIYALMGPNGAGKTTLLNILSFLDAPSSGSVHFCSHPVPFTEPALQTLRKEVVMVDQHPILFTTTVFKNLEFGLKVRQIAKSNRERMIAESLAMVGMQDFAQAPAHRLSGGETQRVALARAFAVAPKVLLCDEPTANVDEENQAIIINILRLINEQKKITIVFTTHDRTQAAALAQQTVFLNRGKITTNAPESNLYHSPIGAKLLPKL